VRYERDGSGWRLLDRSGAVVTRLVAGATVTPRPGLAGSLSSPPVLDDAARASLAEPAALPARLRPATGRDVLGRWTQADPTSSRGGKPPFLNLASDGTWTGWDGCNATSGRWLVGDGGRVLTTSGATTLIGCEGFDLPATWATTARVGIDGGRLVLVDAGGRELLRLKGPDVVASITHGPVVR
jgi:heat shock protein HslJ